MMHIELSHNHGNYFQITYQEDKNRKGKWSSYSIQNLSPNPGYLLKFVAQSQETYLKLKNLILLLFTKEVGRSLTYQTKLIESYSELTFCEYLQPVAEQIRQESLNWFEASSLQVSSAPDLLEGL